MGDPTSSHAHHGTTFRDKFELEKHDLSYADVPFEAVNNVPNVAASPSNHSQNRRVGSKAMEVEEIVRHMSNLPSYLERGKPIQDRALSFGVMDWGRLEKWQYLHHRQGVVQSNKRLPSPSIGHSSLLFLTDGSPPHSSGGRSSSAEKSGTKHISFSEDIHSDLSNEVRRSFQLQTEVVNNKSSLNEATSERNPSSPCRSKTPEERESSVTLKNSDFKMGAIPAIKQRSTPPYRRFSFSMSTKSAALTSATKRAGSPPVSRKSTKDDTSISDRVRSSPLRRLLDPLFSSKAGASPGDSKIEDKVKLDLRSLKEFSVDDSHMNKMDVSSPTMQALFQTVVKNGRPLFTFAVDDNSDILAATVRSLSGKEDSNSWIYTFFTILEVKKKNGRWLSQTIKGKGHGYVPNIAAQMKVSNPSVSNGSTREFVLFSVDPSQLKHQISDVQPQDELAAIIVQFLRKADEEENQDRFSTTVVLPGGHHSIPSKGEPSPLIERWRTGGACDCGGWDMGCRLRTLTDQVQSSRTLNSPDVHIVPGHFELFFQGEVRNDRPFFSLSPLNEGILSVEYNSTLSLLQAFSICISVMECRKSCQHTELRTYVAKQVDDDEAPVTYASFSALPGRV